MAGVEIDLFDSGSNLVASTTTASDGAYLFNGLAADDYTVDIDETTLPTGYTLTTGNEPAAVTLLADDAAFVGANFGYTTTTGGSGGTVLSDTWSLADGVGWDSGLWLSSVVQGGVVDVQGSEGRIGITTGGASLGRAIATMASTADAELLTSFRFSDVSTAARFSVWLRASGDWSSGSDVLPTDGYRITIDNNSPNMRLQVINAGATTNLTSPTSVGEATTTKQWLRMRVEGDTISASVWTDGTTEPATWEITATDTSVASGVLQLGFRRSTGTLVRDLFLDDLVLTDLRSEEHTSELQSH